MIRRHNDLSPLKIEEFKILMIFVEKKYLKLFSLRFSQHFPKVKSPVVLGETDFTSNSLFVTKN